MAPTYLVTGASRGIGQAIVHTLAHAGFSVITISRTHITKTANIDSKICDLSDPQAIAVLGQLLVDKPIAGIIHAAGVLELGTIAQAKPDAWINSFRVNSLAPVLLTQAVLPQLRSSHGKVIFINSTQGKRTNGNWGAYAASKYALTAIADTLRAEEPDITVSTIFPGRTATDMQAQVADFENTHYQPERWIEPTTIARVVVDLLQLPHDATVPEITIQPSRH